MSDDSRVLKNVAAGAVGGLLASFAMNGFLALWARATEQPPQVEDDATVKTADAISRGATGHGVPPEYKDDAGAAVHFLYGTSLGALYGLLESYAPVVAVGRGTAYGAAAWVGGDLVAVPGLGLSKPPTETPASSHAEYLAAHVIYGATVDGVMRLVRGVWK